MREDSIGNRMKENYESRYRIKLTRRMPVIIRLDGKAFHTLTKKCEKPFDTNFSETMKLTGLMLMSEIQGAKCAYIQSDEISFLITDFDRLTTEGWFDYNLQKIVSVSAGIASAYFTKNWEPLGDGHGMIAVFDSRAFNIPKEEVCNYFIWRQQDWVRNSIQMLAQSHYSHKELYGRNQPAMHEMLHEKGINWANLEDRWKNGIYLDSTESEIESIDAPIFTKDRECLEKHLKPTEEQSIKSSESL